MMSGSKKLARNVMAVFVAGLIAACCSSSPDVEDQSNAGLGKIRPVECEPQSKSAKSEEERVAQTSNAKTPPARKAPAKEVRDMLGSLDLCGESSANHVRYRKKAKMTRSGTRGAGAALGFLKAPPHISMHSRSSVCGYRGDFNTEQYDRIYENEFALVLGKPRSTFSIDVDAASYSNVRRFLNNNRLPPEDAVRIEEMINYFEYDYPQPAGAHPFSITTEVGVCPWNSVHRLVHIGLQGRKISTDALPSSNLVFLIDVSGSMSSPNKLPLLKSAMKMLVKNLRSKDRVSMVVYAGAAGLVLPCTPGSDQQKILYAIDNLNAGGSTAGGAGIRLAYETAKQNRIPDGNNRVILATDGDFNVGVSSDGELVRMIENKRKHGIFLTVLGFGTGNYKDSKMEKLADKGNGNYAYIDNLLEAKKVLVREMGSTLHTIAKDVKLQVEFNPAVVRAYRLVGYENRLLRDRDFNDDTKDAGELGAGHTVTALYEVVPAGVNTQVASVDPLKYQAQKAPAASENSDEILTVKFRYKEPQASKSKLIVKALNSRTLKDNSSNFRFSAAVAGFGMLLRNSKYKGALSFEQVRSMANAARGKDPNAYRAEFIRMIDLAEILAGSKG